VKFTRKGPSKNLRDLRGSGGGGGLGGGLGGGRLPIPLPTGKGGMAGGGLLMLIVIVAAVFLGGNVLGGGGGGGIGGNLDDLGVAPQASGAAPDPDAKLVDFVSNVLDDNQQFWGSQFASGDKQYEDAQLVLFNRPVTTGGCGPATSASGPFYCPADSSVYLDLGFFRELRSRFGAPGDFAQAYVIAHELGHHVQNKLGIESEMRRLQARDPSRRNELSVRLELQADCLAGVWAHSTYERGILEPGDIEEGLAAASAVGDDRLGARSPEQWTHGSSALRTKWFTRGYEQGRADACDTFAGSL
jgi:predicted metalloprotease